MESWEPAGTRGAERAGFVLDLGRCLGCGACVVACRLEHGWTSATARRRLVPLNEKRHPGGPTYSLSVSCHHCERPACAAACPSGAYERRADGIVMHHPDRCIGCRYCEMACPFGAPRFDADRGVMTKCDFCRERVDRGERPACIAACPTEALRLRPPDAAADPAGDKQARPVYLVTEFRQRVPGFDDLAGCKPCIRFVLPRGARGRRLAAFLAKRGEKGA